MARITRRRSGNDERTERSIYNRLAVLRAERNLSRQDLANALDVNYQTVGYIERGDFNPGLELAFRISELFHLPIEAIFSRSRFTPMSDAFYGRSQPDRVKEQAHE